MATQNQSAFLLSCVGKMEEPRSCSEEKDERVSDSVKVDESLVLRRLSQEKPLTTTVPELNIDLMGHPTFVVKIPRAKEGFGFTVFGCSPVQVGRVEEGSPAWAAQLHQDDYIVKINGINVSRSTAESVAKLVRNSSLYLVLEVFRSRSPMTTTTSNHHRQQFHYNSDSAVVFDSFSTTSSSTFCTESSDDLTSHFESSSSLSSSSSRSSALLSASMVLSNVDDSVSTHPYFSSEMANVQKTQNLLSKRLHSHAPSPRRTPLSSVTNRIQVGSVQNNKLNNNQNSNCLPANNNKANDTLNNDTINRSNGCLPRMGIKSKRQPPVSNPRHMTTTALTPPMPIPIHGDIRDSTTTREDERNLQACMVELKSCIEDFVMQCQLGINRFFKPLRAAGLPQDQFKTLFQNIEMILSLSEQLYRQVQSSGQSSNNSVSLNGHSHNDIDDDDQLEGFFSCHVFIEALASFLEVKMESFCDSYERYCSGLRQALIMLVSLKKDSKFGPIIKSFSSNNSNKSFSCNTSFSTFLQQPLKHIKDLVMMLQRAASLSVMMGYENEKLRRIIHLLRLSCNRINENHKSCSNSSLNTIASSVFAAVQIAPQLNPTETTNVNRLKPTLSAFTNSPTFFPATKSSSSSSSASVPPFSESNVVSSIDKELLDIQSKLVFSSYVRAFHLATATRHLIYSGNLELVDQDGSRCNIFLVLASDMLLMTRPDYVTQNLNVVDDPVVLRDIVGCEFNSRSPLELIISVETRLTSLQRPWAPKTFCLRAPTEELKVTWKNILEQRILTSKNDRDVALTTKSMENIV